MASSLTIRFRRFPYLVIGWALLAGLSLLAPDRMFLTHQQGLWVGLAFLGVGLLRGARQMGRELPAEIGALELSRLPRQSLMQYFGHGFSWDSQHANEVVAAERDSKALVGPKRKPGDLGGVAVIHAVGLGDGGSVRLPVSGREGHTPVPGAALPVNTEYAE